MYYTPLLDPIPAPQPLVFEADKLVAALQQVTDLRSPHGKRYPLAPMLFIAALAKLCGYDHIYHIAHFATLYGPQLVTLLGLSNPTMPHYSTWYRW